MDLVVQAPSIDDADLAAIASLAGARDILTLRDAAAMAFRLRDVRTRADVAEWCTGKKIDHGFVAHDLTRDRVALVAMDMDSTLITIECVDEIADLAGIKPQVAAITASAMRGEIEFRESLIRRVALLAGLPLSALQRIYDERVKLSPGAERMLAGFSAVGAKTLLVSGGFTFYTDRLKNRLQLDDTVSNTLEVVDGKLTGRLSGPIVDADVKATRLIALKEALGRSGRIALGIGDGANDLPMMRAADISVAYHAKPVVRAEATYAIDYCGLDAVLNLFL